MNPVPESQNASTSTPRPPQLISSLVGGFNTVTNHIYLILPPVVLDLLLWFGPHLRVKQLVEPELMSVIAYFSRESTTQEMRNMVPMLENVWRQFLERYNLLTVLSTFPIGIPAMLSNEHPVQTPLGQPVMIEIGSYGQMLLGWLACAVVGILLGSFYFAVIARATSQQLQEPGCDPELRGRFRTPSLRPGVLLWQMVQALVLVILLVIILMVLMVPAFLMASFLALVSPILAQMALLLISLSAIWFLIPMVFSPHGIFACGMSVLNALFTSTRVVRYILPGTGLFLLACIVLYQGLGLLWHAAPHTSWMTLVGVLGNAFIVTGLLAASFVYYRSGLNYVQSLRKPAPQRA